MWVLLALLTLLEGTPPKKLPTVSHSSNPCAIRHTRDPISILHGHKVVFYSVAAVAPWGAQSQSRSEGHGRNERFDVCSRDGTLSCDLVYLTRLWFLSWDCPMDNPSFTWISSLQSPFQIAFLIALHLGGEVSGWECGQNLSQRWCRRNFLDESLWLGRASAGEVAQFFSSKEVWGFFAALYSHSQGIRTYLSISRFDIDDESDSNLLWQYL